MKKQAPATMTRAQAEFCRLVRANTGRHRAYDVFRDFCELSAVSFSNAADHLNHDRREARYLEIASRYQREELDRFSAMLACVIRELEHDMTDCLGQLFMALELGDAGKGQFFTPYEVSLLMSGIALTGAEDVIKRHGFITVNEPAVGAGGMVIAAAQTLRDARVNYQQTMHVVAVDIDPLACHMAFIQFSLLHIPAVVVHGNALLPDSTWDEWLTPAHIMGGWDRKLAQRRAVDDMHRLMTSAREACAREPEPAMELVTIERVQRKRQAQADQMALF